MKALLAAVSVFLASAGCDEPHRPPPPDPVLDPTQSGFSLDRATAIVHEVVTAKIVLRDTTGAPMAGLQVTLAATGELNTITQPAPTDDAGEAWATWTTTRAEMKSITAMLPDSSSLGPRNVLFLAAAPSKLVFQTQPLDVEAGEPLGVRVAFEDADDNLASSTLPVTLQLSANPSLAELQGMRQASPQVGVATFAGLHVDVAGTSYTMIASATGLPDVQSELFDVAAGAPVEAKSSLTASPYSNDADGISAAAIALRVRNQYDVPIASLPVAITVTGTGNLLGASTLTTAADGATGTTLKSTTAETKTVSANVGPFTLTAPLAFFPPPCTVMLPNRPTVPFEFTPRAMVTADIDHDGNVDIVDAEQITVNPPHQSQLVIRRGRGDGRFVPGVAIPIVGAAAFVSAVDVDGDGDLDLVATVSDQPIAYVLRQSTGAMFGAATTVTLDGAASGLAFGDVNEDGTLDLIADLRELDRVAVHAGTGGGIFGASTLLVTGDIPTSVALADFDRDGHLDVGVSQFGEGSYSTFLGRGDGTFDVRRTRGAVYAGSQVVADLNHDAVPDVLVASMQGDGFVSLLGAGDGTFQIAGWGFSSELQAPSIALADLNADTHLDLVVAATPSLVVLAGTGTGAFTALHRYTDASLGAQLPEGMRGGLAIADLDNDGVLDVVTAGLGINVMTGVGAGAFVAPAQQGPARSILHAPAVDFDGDGRSDLLVTTDFAMSVLRGEANGALTLGSPFTDANQSTIVTAGDVDEDGREDVVLLGSSEFGMQYALRVGLGSGSGTFSFGPNIPSILSSPKIQLAKIDADTHLDLIGFRGDSPRGVYFSSGDGAGSFTGFSGAPSIPTTYDPRDLVVGDLDNDGDLDLVVAETRQLTTLANDGTGTFTATSYAIPDLDSLDSLTSVVIGDFDQDTWLDLAVGHYLGRIDVFRGTAGGTFDPVPDRYQLRSSLLLTSVGDLAARDMDGDGTLDLVIAGAGLWIAQGFGNGDFRPPRHYNLVMYGGLGEPEYVLGDRDGNGRPDVVSSTRLGISIARQGVCKPFVP